MNTTKARDFRLTPAGFAAVSVKIAKVNARAVKRGFTRPVKSPARASSGRIASRNLFGLSHTSN